MVFISLFKCMIYVSNTASFDDEIPNTLMSRASHPCCI